MKIKNMNKKKIGLMILLSILIVTASLFFVGGCTDTIEGTANTNLRPIVQFVNIPPEGQQFSRNPEIYWIGNDPDGLIDYYRYHIALESDVIALGSIDAYVATLTNDDWIQKNIEHDQSDPQTTNVISLIADTLNPVTNPIAQFVLLQAFDRENLGSLVASRLFKRNDNPPDTKILTTYQDALPFVNSIIEGGVVTGIRLQWEGSDRKDYDEIGLTPPPFDYEWRLYGPFSKSILNDSIIPNKIERLVVTEDAHIKHFGESDTRCQSVQKDTIIGGIDTTITIDSCITTVFDSNFFAHPVYPEYYSVQRILHIEDPLIDTQFVRGSFNGVDEWVQDTKDSIYNVYSKNPEDTTVELNFIFWVRSRDDAFVKDLTPAFIYFPVINPMYERDIVVIDFTPISEQPNNGSFYKKKDTAKAFWHNIIHKWSDDRLLNGLDTIPIIYDTTVFTFAQVPDLNQAGKTGIDYIVAQYYGSNGIPIKYLLKHKVIILYNEAFQTYGFVGNTVKYPEILSAMDAGINVWATWRNPLNVFPGLKAYQEPLAPFDYTRYFGVTKMAYSAWNAFSADLNIVFGVDPNGVLVRNEDFVGTYSVDETSWPSLDIDTSLLHSRLEWFDNYSWPYDEMQGWRDTIAAVPEVNWAARTAGTEVMYLYKSKYGANYDHDYEGAPVGHRLETNLFKTVHFNFTLLTIDSLQAQTISNNVMNWLYSRKLNSSTVQENRYKDAPNRLSIDDARRVYDERLIEQAIMRSAEKDN